MIFNWISRCWGGMGITTQFQKARINCTIADWTVPFQDDILILITSFQDKNPQIPAKTAVNIFLSHLETDQQKAHPAFLLKHLYVLDHCIEEMTALDIIGYYYNSNLTAMKSSKNMDLNDSRSPLRQLINSYYAYLITKARTFGHYQKTYFSKELKPQSMTLLESSAHNIQTKTYDDQVMPSQISLPSGGQFDFVCSSGRKKRSKSCTRQQRSIFTLFEKETSYNSIFDIIQKCQQLQKLIVQMNKNYQLGNRKVQLIKYIFIMCLWTFIRCYVIVSVGMKYLFKHFLSMSLKQLQRFIKTFQYFNNQYTADFIRFVQSNKNQIDIFKQINYNQLTYVNKDGMRILLDYKEQIKSKENMKVITTTKKMIDIPSIKRMNSESSHRISGPVYPTISDEIEDMKVLQLPIEVHTRIKQNMKIFYKPRKNMDFCLMENTKKVINQPYVYDDHFQEYQMEDAFFNHQNLYHQAFTAQTSEQINGQIQSHKSQLSVSNIKQSPAPIIKVSTTKEQPIKPRKLSIDMDIELNKKEEKKDVNSIDKEQLKQTTQKLLGSRTQQRSKQPIKPSEMSEIKEMFHHQERKKSRKYSAWQTWENQYGENNDLITTKN